ncbi:MAG: YbgC/FadM family acyl-CoA thioesterase [Betaproteobacteria bacterium]|nr:YbgC/FadM family acyl-CoA thioesterase [Betaproteobacteria bacterium]
MARSEFRFFHPLRVRWAEVDRQGIVFNAHYLLYCDVGITEYWRRIGLPYPEGLIEHGSDLYVVKATLEYHRSALYDDEIDVGVRVARIGRSSLVFGVEMHRGDDHLVSGEIVYVNADPETRRSSAVPAFLRDAVRAFEGRDPSA